MFVRLFQSVDDQVTNHYDSRWQGVAKIVNNFDGSDPKAFKDWVKSIEKYSTLTGVQGDRIKLIAYQASQGPVSDFLKRYLDANPNNTWDQVKVELKSRFGEVIDSEHALLLLRRVKQKPQESIQVYAERLLTLGENTFDGQGDWAMQRQLVGYFNGLLNDLMKMKVMRENPNTFNDAVTMATTEQNLRRRFQLRTGRDREPNNDTRVEVPMEVDHMRSKDKCFY